MSDAKEILLSIASKVGATGYDNSSPKNLILERIAVAYGAVITDKSRNGLLRAIDLVVNGSTSEDPRNNYLKTIAEGVGSPALPDNESRNFYLSAWDANV